MSLDCLILHDQTLLGQKNSDATPKQNHPHLRRSANEGMTEAPTHNRPQRSAPIPIPAPDPRVSIKQARLESVYANKTWDMYYRIVDRRTNRDF